MHKLMKQGYRKNIKPGFKKGLEAKMDSSVKKVLKNMKSQNIYILPMSP